MHSFSSTSEPFSSLRKPPVGTYYVPSNVVKLNTARTYRDQGASLREAGQIAGLPKSTLHDREQKEARSSLDQEVFRFLTSPAGHEFFRKLMICLVVIFCTDKKTGGRGLGEFVLAIGVQDIHARSHTSWCEFIKAVETEIRDFGSIEGKRLGDDMPDILHAIANDETFFKGRTCLVSIDLISGFILNESFAENRTSETWQMTLEQATEKMSQFKIGVMASDCAKGLISFASSLGIFHTPDLFHVQHDICKGLSLPVSRSLKAAEEQLLECREQFENTKQQAQSSAEVETKGRGRPVSWEARLKVSEEALDVARKEYNQALSRKKDFSDALSAISNAMSPVDFETGLRRGATLVEADLKGAFKDIFHLAEELEVSDSGIAKLLKAQRQIEGLVGSISSFTNLTGELAGQFNLNREESYAWHNYLISAFYLERVSQNKSSVERKKAQSLAKELKEKGLQAFQDRTKEFVSSVLAAAENASGLFQRASSCVEGRNGYLSLIHHGLRGLSQERLEALTVLANYHHTREDGTTAAERFFKKPHRNLLEHLFDVLPGLPKNGGVRKNQKTA